MEVQSSEREKEKIRKIATFQIVAHEWFSRQSTQWTERHSIGVLSSLKMHVFPDLGQIPIADISNQDLIATLRKLEAEGKFEACFWL